LPGMEQGMRRGKGGQGDDSGDGRSPAGHGHQPAFRLWRRPEVLAGLVGLVGRVGRRRLGAVLRGGHQPIA